MEPGNRTNKRKPSGDASGMPPPKGRNFQGARGRGGRRGGRGSFYVPAPKNDVQVDYPPARDSYELVRCYAKTNTEIPLNWPKFRDAARERDLRVQVQGELGIESRAIGEPGYWITSDWRCGVIRGVTAEAAKNIAKDINKCDPKLMAVVDKEYKWLPCSALLEGVSGFHAIAEGDTSMLTKYCVSVLLQNGWKKTGEKDVNGMDEWRITSFFQPKNGFGAKKAAFNMIVSPDIKKRLEDNQCKLLSMQGEITVVFDKAPENRQLDKLCESTQVLSSKSGSPAKTLGDVKLDTLTKSVCDWLGMPTVPDEIVKAIDEAPRDTWDTESNAGLNDKDKEKHVGLQKEITKLINGISNRRKTIQKQDRLIEQHRGKKEHAKAGSKEYEAAVDAINGLVMKKRVAEQVIDGWQTKLAELKAEKANLTSQ